MALVLNDAPDVYHMGLNTFSFSRAQLHGGIRDKFLAAFRQHLERHGVLSSPGIVLIQGGGPFNVYSTDGELVFRQEAYMHYLFGVGEEDWYGALDVKTGRTHLFMPRLPEAYAVWMGPLMTPEQNKAKYAADEVHFVDDMPAVLKQLLVAQAPKEMEGAAGGTLGPLHVLNGINTDSGREVAGARFEGDSEFVLEGAHLFPVLTECRVHKTPEEIAIMKYANEVGARGHVEMMRAAKPGMMEYQLESLYLHTVYSSGGCRLPNYTPIAASGHNGAVLHYGHAGAPNDRQIQDGDMVLVDMGCEYYRYGSDITCSWPANGKFSPAQRVVYGAVLAAHGAVISAIKPGVAWTDMQALAYRTMLEHLKEGGIVTGAVEDMMAADIGALFMPHGLGHFLGIDTHDVGGYQKGFPLRSGRPGFKSLRTARVLEPGMVVTVEPGCYFSAALLEPALKDPAQSKFLVHDSIKDHMDFGGVRIEDNILVTDTGAQSMTHVPRTHDEIEAIMAGGAWPS